MLLSPECFVVGSGCIAQPDHGTRVGDGVPSDGLLLPVIVDAPACSRPA